MKRKRIGLLAVYLVLGVQLLASGQATLHQQEVEPAFQDALDLFYKDQFAASREAFEQLRLHELSREKSIEVHYYQGLSSLRGDFPEGTSSLEAFVLDYPEEPLAHEAAWVLGNHYFTGRNYREAIENFGRLRGIPLSQERHPELLFKTGYSFFQLKNYSQAQNYFERAKRYKSPFLASAYYYAGFSAFQQKDFETAVTNFKEAEKSREFSLKVPYMLTALYYQQGDLPQVIAYAAPIIDKAGLEKREQVHLLLSEAYYADNAYEQAAYHYQSFVSAKKGALSRDQQYKAGVAHYEISQFQIASNFFKEVALLSDALGQVSSYFLGHAYIQLENLPFAANSFSAAYKMDFNPEIKEEALFNYAKVNLEMGKFQEAVTALDQYLNDYPRGTRFAQAEDLLSDALINTNNYLRAIQHMERMQQPSARIREAYQKVTFYQAMAYFRDNNPSGTLQLLDKSLRYPEDKSLQVLAQFWKGEANAVANKPEAAIQAYERVLAMNPPSSDPALIKTHYGLGYAYFNQGSYNKAERQFKAYTDKLRNNREKEQYHDALLRLGDVYYIQKKFDDRYFLKYPGFQVDIGSVFQLVVALQGFVGTTLPVMRVRQVIAGLGYLAGIRVISQKAFQRADCLFVRLIEYQTFGRFKFHVFQITAAGIRFAVFRQVRRKLLRSPLQGETLLESHQGGFPVGSIGIVVQNLFIIRNCLVVFLQGIIGYRPALQRKGDKRTIGFLGYQGTENLPSLPVI
jgi:tetratricopeptide (TPR) repeat protein